METSSDDRASHSIRVGASAALLTLSALGAATAQAPRSTADTISVRLTTQLAFDLAADGRTIVMDLLGQLWTLPSDGGEARALTDAVRDTAEDLEPVFSPDGHWVAFQADRPQGRGLWLLSSTGGAPRLIIAESADRIWPAWSPDGARIAFVRNRALALLTVSSGRIDTLRIAGPPNTAVREPVWTPDGHSLLFVNAPRFSSLGGFLWQVPDTGGGATRVGTADLRINAPAISSDGRLAFFVRDSLGVHQLWVADSLGGAPRRVTSHDDTTPLRVRWTPDGRSVVYHADGQLWRLRVADGSRERIELRATLSLPRHAWNAPPIRLSAPGSVQHARGYRGIALSPDGKRIALLALDTLWVFAPGARPRALTAVPPEAEDLAWSPDGRHLAWSSGTERDIFVTAMATGRTHQLTALPNDEYRPSWSPDGRYIAFMHGPAGWQEQRARVVRADAADPVRSADSTRAVGVDGYGRYRPEDGNVQDAPQWTADSRAVLLFDPPTRRLVRTRLDGGVDTLPRTLLNVAFAQVLGDSAMVFIRNDRLWWAGFHADSGLVGAPRRLGEGAATSPSVARDGTILYVSSDGLRLRQPNGTIRRLGWPVAYRVPTAPPLLLRNVRILLPDSGRLSSARDILVRDGRIRQISRAGSMTGARGAWTLDAAGRVVISGLMDLHQHLWGGHLQLRGLLDNGVTTVRDVGSPISRTAAMRDEIEAGLHSGPRVVFGGLMFHTTSPEDGGYSSQLSHSVDDDSAVAPALDLLRGFGADYLKLYQFSRWSEAVRVIEQAHARGLRVTGHIAHVLPFVAAGIDGKEHVGRAGGYHRADSFVYDDIVALFRTGRVDIVPTISFFASAARFYDDSSQLSAPEARPFLSSYAGFSLANLPSPTRNAAQRRSWQRITEISRAATGRLYAGGVRIGVGTDGVFPPWGVHWEMEELVASGLSPAEAIRAATSDAAAILGSPDVGRVAAGYVADLVILEANPLDDIRNTRRIWRVIKAGRVHRPTASSR